MTLSLRSSSHLTTFCIRDVGMVLYNRAVNSSVFCGLSSCFGLMGLFLFFFCLSFISLWLFPQSHYKFCHIPLRKPDLSSRAFYLTDLSRLVIEVGSF
jgi:hypothetical protein